MKFDAETYNNGLVKIFIYNFNYSLFRNETLIVLSIFLCLKIKFSTAIIGRSESWQKVKNKKRKTRKKNVTANTGEELNLGPTILAMGDDNYKLPISMRIIPQVILTVGYIPLIIN